ncbi:hypothetical protein DAPPUDRAFT_306244 [Daphnia pulex]|uniref:Shavenoid isoform B-like N-terminal domain-containing protein n=1 Tax=Daphnia pulex TaxID=6669 RepID=E9GW27_DAPPU|nr:hypothetical protein DAPPUDRAFT_306244 [Daphnia pulex]|eukprot:EFX76342.1 hypothetical protein DAPPUDRAFT_306244 [Daphnia pulex]
MHSTAGFGLALLAFFQIALAIMTTAGPSTINRHSQGDIFSHQGAAGECNAAACLSALGQRNNGSLSAARLGRHCQCQCPMDRPIYREDLKQCVSTIDECALADYVSGIQSEKVPFVFLPIQGQLINPNAEIALSDVRAEGQVVVSPVCVVSKSHFLTRSGWMASDNSSSGIATDRELPFALARESGRTHLQWLGEPRLRSLMEGRIVLVKLLCKDTANARIGVFSPCIAFRVAGSPGLVESIRGAGGGDEKSGLRHADYLAIGISSALLGMLYVAGLVGFICYRRRKRQLENVHIKLSTQPSTPVQELGIMRLNPLLQSSRTSSRPASSDPSLNEGNRRSRPTNPAGNIHPTMNNYRYSSSQSEDCFRDSSVDASAGHEAAAYYYRRDSPMMTNDANRRLYFSPAYFDLELLKQSPPPAALEFLTRIRGMIDVAKDKMSSKRFMPSLIDIPEELSHYSGYGGSNQGLSHYADELRRSGSFHNRPPFTTVVDETEGLRNSYGTLKRPTTKKYDSLQRNSLGRKAATGDNGAAESAILSENNNKDDIYHPMELRTNFLQKSPLPGRKSTGLSSETMNLVSIYTNPSIEEIYRSLDRSQPPRLNKGGGAESGAESDAVSDLVSEAESKMPKITGPGMNRKTYFEPDSLDRKPATNYGNSSNNSKPHLYQKKPPRWTKRAQQHQSDTNDEMREADENSSSAAGYTSSTCTSMKSLSRVLPAEEAMEVGNQLFNMDTGAPTLPRLIKPTIVAQPNRGGANIYETIGRNQEPDGIFVNKEFKKPPPEVIYSSSNTSSSSSKITIVEDCLKNKLTIQVDDIRSAKDEEAFEPDTLDRRNDSQCAPPFRRQESFIADSLERPIQPVKSTINKFSSNAAGNVAPVSPSSSSSGLGSSGESLANKEDWIKKEELPPPGSVVSLRQIYTARTHQPKPETWATATLEATKKPPSRIVSASNTQILLRLAGNDDSRIYGHHSALVAEPNSPPPLPIKAMASPSSAPAIPRELKPPTGVHQHPKMPKQQQQPPPPPYSSRGVQTESTPPPTLPPKNGKGGSSGKAAAEPATSAKKGLGDDDDDDDDDDSKIYSGHFILSHPSPSGTIKLPNVLERIAQIEREESRTSGASKGMEIALSLKARMGHLEGSLKDHKKTLSIKKTWRKLLDKVEDSFSETESAGSTLRRPPSSAAKLLKKSLPPPPPSDEENDTDDDSQSSLGSDGTGRDRYSINDGMSQQQQAVDQATDGIKLKSFYTFGEDGHGKPSPVAPISTSTIKSNSSSSAAHQSRRSGISGGSVGSNLGRKLRTNDSYDSGLYSSNYSTYIGDY